MSNNKDFKQRKAPQRGPMGMMQAGGKPKHFKATMKKFIKYLRPFWFSIFIVVVFAVASTVFTIISPKILGKMTNQIVDDYVNIKAYEAIHAQLPSGIILEEGTKGEDLIQKMPPAILSNIPDEQLNRLKNLDLTTRPTINFSILKGFASTLIALYIFSSLFSYIQGWIMTGVTQKITYELRKNISEKINRLPLKYYDSQPIGDVLSRVTNDVDTIGQTLNQSLIQIITSVTTIIGFIIMMLSISWKLTLLSLIVLPTSFTLIGIIISRSQKYFKQQQDSLGDINGHVEEMYGGHNIVKAFNGEKRSIARFQEINSKLYESAWKSQFLSGLMFPMMNFTSNISFVGVTVYGGILAVRGELNIGDIQAFISYVRQFNQPIAQSATIANVLQSTAAAAERVFEFLDEKEEISETENPVELAKVKGAVKFNNVVFGYNKDKTIIKGFNANIRPGQKIAIVGPTGAGKTTIVNLLMRFYDVNKGAIEIDNIDTRNMRRSDLRKMFGMVLQDTWLFNGTIKQNIAYGKQHATDEEIYSAAKAAQVDHFVHALPKGYDTEINEEANNISQGEKQLITIARAMLANPPILILDEATSSVDTRTEILIQKAMERLMKGRTSFVIAHRLSTIKEADLILVMNEGNIVEQGTHKELLAANGFYANLYNSQFLAPMVEV